MHFNETHLRHQAVLSPTLTWLLVILFYTLSPPCRGAIIEVTDHIRTNTTWTGDNTYYLKIAGVSIVDNAKLTIQAGAVVKIQPGGEIFVTSGSKLEVNGTSADPVYFTSRDENTKGSTVVDSDGNPEPGDWLSIVFSPSAVDDGTEAHFTYAHFRYGGGTMGVYQAPMLRVHGGSPTFHACEFYRSSYIGFGGHALSDLPITPEFTSCVFQQNDVHGLAIDDDRTANGSIPKIWGCHFSGNGTDTATHAAINIEDNVFPDWGTAANTVEKVRDRGLNGVRCSGSINVSGTWAGAGTDFPHCSTVNLADGADLTILAGVTVKLSDRGGWPGMDVTPGATLTVNGTAQAPVVFTSVKDDDQGRDTNGDGNATSAGPGDWLSISMWNDSGGLAAQGNFNYAHFRYGGGWPGVYQRGMLWLRGISPTFDRCDFFKSKYTAVEGSVLNDTPAEPTFTDCTFRENERGGIWIYAYQDSPNGSRPVISGCDFRANGTTLDDGAVELDNNVFPDWGNADNTVQPSQGKGANAVLVEGVVTLNGAWNKPGLDFPYYIEGGFIQVDPNATLTIGPGVIMKMANQGINVRAGGTLNVAGTSQSRVVFTSHQDDEQGGDSNGDGSLTEPAAGDWREIYFQSDDGGKRAAGTLNHAVIKYGGFGNQMVAIGGCAPVIKNSELSYSMGWAVRAWRDHGMAPDAKINDCLITHNGNGILNLDDQHCLDATHNDWGHFTGPKDDSDADDCADYYNPASQGDTVSDHVLVWPWVIPEGSKLLEVNANLQARSLEGRDATLALDVYTHQLTLTNFSLTLDLTEAEGVTVDETRSTHPNPFTADSFSGGLFTYFLNMAEESKTILIKVIVASAQDSVTLRVPMHIEDYTGTESTGDVNVDGAVDTGDVVSLVNHLLDKPEQ